MYTLLFENIYSLYAMKYDFDIFLILHISYFSYAENFTILSCVLLFFCINPFF